MNINICNINIINMLNMNLITKLPDDLLYKTINYHPLFFRYRREYNKLFIFNSNIHNSICITNEEYNILIKHKYNYINTLIKNDSITKNIIFELRLHYNPLNDNHFGNMSYE